MSIVFRVDGLLGNMTDAVYRGQVNLSPKTLERKSASKNQLDGPKLLNHYSPNRHVLPA